MELIRFGVSIQDHLLERFDNLITEKGYANRSEAIRDLIRNSLVEDELETRNEETVGTIAMVYDHHTRELSDKLTGHQHSHFKEIISSLHVHLDQHNCLEVVVAKGKNKKIKQLAQELIGTKGVKYGRLMSTPPTGKNL
ncbi:nickel-responsive transcriptional regulator NikR [Desulfobacterota bacterium M19]